MKEIGIIDFEKLVMERLTMPRNFTGRSLVLWNADYMFYGIAQRVIKQCCENYNKANPNDQVWFKESGKTFYKDDYTQPKTWYSRMVWNENSKKYESCGEWKRFGILFNTGCYMLNEQADWLKFVNTHTNKKGGVFQDCAVIVCAQAGNVDYYIQPNPEYNLKEKQFGECCDIYHIQPTIEEWTKWVEPLYDAEIIKVVRAYIEKNGVFSEFDYGFDYWMRIMDTLNFLKKKYSMKENKDCSLWQIPEEKLSFQIGGAVSESAPAPDFCKFIYSFLKDNPSKE